MLQGAVNAKTADDLSVGAGLAVVHDSQGKRKQLWGQN